MKNKLCVIIACMMEKLGVDEYKLSNKDFKRIKTDTKKYCGLSIYNDNHNNIIIKRIKTKDLTLADLIEGFINE